MHSWRVIGVGWVWPKVSGGSLRRGELMSSTAMTSVPGMIPAFPPVWAEVFGEDEFGVFAEFVLKEVRFVWRWIPPGRFWMGSPEDEVERWDAEGPQHEVTISRGFWMGETPVTQTQWMALRADNRPVEKVTWDQSESFAVDLNAAIPGLAAGVPTEAQWEYACRAGTTGAFHDGSACTVPEGLDPALDRLGWFDRNSGDATHPVKQKLPNAWGLYDLHGNVWEGCRDRWEIKAYAAREGGVVDPASKVGDLDVYRVIRGGSYRDYGHLCRSAFRRESHPFLARDNQGFRLAAGQEFQAAEPHGAERLPPERRSRG